MGQYRYKRKKEEQSLDMSPKKINVEGAERVRAKRVIRQELTEIQINKDQDIIDMINEEAREAIQKDEQEEMD